MASTKTRVKPIRIKNETAEYFEKKPLNRMVESLYELLQSGSMTFDGENLKPESVYTEKKSEKSGLTPSKEVEEIESMANFFGITLETMLGKIYEGLNDGTLSYEGGKIVGVPDLDLDNFKDACHEKGVDPQTILDKATLGVRRGTI